MRTTSPAGNPASRTTDIAMEWPPGPLRAHHLPVHELLTCRPRPRVRPEDDVAKIAAIMLGAREDALPVVDADGRLLGLVTVWHCLELLAGARACDTQGHLTLESPLKGAGNPDRSTSVHPPSGG